MAESLASEHLSDRPTVQEHAIKNDAPTNSVEESKPKRGRPKGSKNRTSKKQDSVDAAQYTVDAIEVIGVMLGGDEFRYLKSDEHGIDERSGGIVAFTRFYEEKGIKDIPPGIALTLWGIAYAGSRLAMPNTQSRLQKLWGYLRQKFFRKGSKDRNKKPASDNPAKTGGIFRNGKGSDT